MKIDKEKVLAHYKGEHDKLLNEKIMQQYHDLAKEVGSYTICIFYQSSHNRNREIQAMEESYLETGCKNLCAGEEYNGLPLICPDYMCVNVILEVLGLENKVRG